MAENENTRQKAPYEYQWSPLKPHPEPQDYPGLDAAGFLLVALGHLVKAKEKLDQEPPSRAQYNARYWTICAANNARYALKVLDEQKEETCKKS